MQIFEFLDSLLDELSRAYDFIWPHADEVPDYPTFVAERLAASGCEVR
jgi:hypothetical protein